MIKVLVFLFVDSNKKGTNFIFKTCPNSQKALSDQTCLLQLVASINACLTWLASIIAGRLWTGCKVVPIATMLVFLLYIEIFYAMD